MSNKVAGRRRIPVARAPVRAGQPMPGRDAATPDVVQSLAGRPRVERRAECTARLDAWQLRMRSEGNSERTVLERRRVVEVAAREAGQLATELSRTAIETYLAGLQSQGTRAAYFAALKAWFRWLVDFEEARADNPMRKLRAPRQPRRTPRPITTAERDRALARITRHRTRTYLLLAVYHGLRVHEIARVRGEDLDLAAMTLRVVGKGRLVASLPLHPSVAELAGSYPATGWWFPARDGEHGHVSPKTVSHVLGQALRRAGVNASAHQLRHWYGTQVLRSAGGNLRVAQELLRHASANTTAGYTHVDDAERRAAIVALPQLAGTAVSATSFTPATAPATAPVTR